MSKAKERTRPRELPAPGYSALGLGSRGDPLPPVDHPKEDEEPRITAARERLTGLLAWLVEHDTDDPFFSTVEAAYHAQATAINVMRRGPLEYLSRPGDEWVGPPVIFPGDDPTIAIPGGKWRRLADGRIEAYGLTIYDLRVMATFKQLAQEARGRNDQTGNG